MSIVIIYLLITGAVFTFLFSILHSKRKAKWKYDVSERVLRSELSSDALKFARSFPFWNHPLLSKFWIQETHRLDRLQNLDAGNNNGSQLLRQLFSWASQKQILENSQVSIDYNLDFSNSFISLRERQLLLSICSYFIRKMAKKEKLNIVLNKSETEIAITFTFDRKQKMRPLKSLYKSELESISAKIIEEENALTIILNNSKKCSIHLPFYISPS